MWNETASSQVFEPMFAVWTQLVAPENVGFIFRKSNNPPILRKIGRLWKTESIYVLRVQIRNSPVEGKIRGNQASSHLMQLLLTEGELSVELPRLLLIRRVVMSSRQHPAGQLVLAPPPRSPLYVRGATGDAV